MGDGKTHCHFLIQLNNIIELRQGDPLSPILFDFVMDVLELEAHTPFWKKIFSVNGRGIGSMTPVV